MKQRCHGWVGVTLVLAMGLSLSACSNISQQVSDMMSSLNPFQQKSEETAPAATPAAPAGQDIPAAPARSYRVEIHPSTHADGTKDVEVNLEGNRQCTTFCALPMRKPPAAAQ